MSNPLIPEIPEQGCRQLVVDGRWAVSIEGRPKGWQSWPVAESDATERVVIAVEYVAPIMTLAPPKPDLGLPLRGVHKRPEVAPTHCTGPGCKNQLGESPQKGNTPLYCSKKCKSKAAHARFKAARRVRKAAGVAA